jgi:hypothetical protein
MAPGEKEMLWVQYEDTPRATVTKVVENIAKYIRPYAVAAFEDRRSGREMIVNGLGDSGDVYDSQNVDDSGQHSGGDNRTTGGPSNEGAGQGGDATNPQRQDENGSNETNQDEGNEDNEPPGGTTHADELRDGNEERRYEHFTGNLRVETQLRKNDLHTAFDLRIDRAPNPNSRHVQLDMIVVTVNTEEAKDSLDPSTDADFVIAKIKIRVGQSGGWHTPPTGARPIEADFFEVVDTTTSRQYEIDSTFSWLPKFTGRFNRGKSEMRRKKPIANHFMLEKLDPSGYNGLLWQYQIFQPSETSLEMSSNTFRTTDATFRFSRSQPPNYIEVMILASYTRKGKLPRFRGILRSDAGIMHVQTRLDVEVGEGNEWFLLPGNDNVNKGIDLEAVLTLEDNKLMGEERKEVANVKSRWRAGKWIRSNN